MLDRAEFKIGGKFTTESWYGVAAPYERTEANHVMPANIISSPLCSLPVTIISAFAISLARSRHLQ
jgi:hypothetical protein